jgi:hypothetical protein
LSYNLLTGMNSGEFTGLTSLQQLYVKLWILAEEDVLTETYGLFVRYLESNLLTGVSGGLFAGLTSLQQL